MRILGSSPYGNRPERLEREFKIDLITTAPSVVYDVHLKDGGVIKVDNPSQASISF